MSTVAYGLPCSSNGKESAREPGFDPWVEKILWRREWQSTPVFLPIESHGPRSLVDYKPWDHKKLDMTDYYYYYIIY